MKPVPVLDKLIGCIGTIFPRGRKRLEMILIFKIMKGLTRSVGNIYLLSVQIQLRTIYRKEVFYRL